MKSEKKNPKRDQCKDLNNYYRCREVASLGAIILKREMPGFSEDTGLMGEWVGWEDSVAGQVILICPVQSGW